jgi:hypothetical protein
MPVTGPSGGLGCGHLGMELKDSPQHKPQHVELERKISQEQEEVKSTP